MNAFQRVTSLITIVLACRSSQAAAGVQAFTQTSQSPEPSSSRTLVTPGMVLTRGLFRLYQQGAAPSKGQSCPMAPSCSEYGRIAFRDHGLILGGLLTADRLHRCGHDLHHYDPIWVQVGRRAYDPVVPR